MTDTKKIYKYQLKIVDEQTVDMPANAKILTVQSQNGNPMLWALVNSATPPEEQTIRIIGTGHPIEDFYSLEYISTFQTPHGLVFHVFKKVSV